MATAGRFSYESLTLNSVGTFFTDRKSGGGHCSEMTVIRGSTVVDSIRMTLSFKKNKLVVLGMCKAIQVSVLELAKLLETCYH